jgi:homeobox domain-containing protein
MFILHLNFQETDRPRLRVCFDPEYEIPLLQKWFTENNHPTRQQVRVFLYQYTV